jgi:hypothetical protein
MVLPDGGECQLRICLVTQPPQLLGTKPLFVARTYKGYGRVMGWGESFRKGGWRRRVSSRN